jgi:hypothetical protein
VEGEVLPGQKNAKNLLTKSTMVVATNTTTTKGTTIPRATLLPGAIQITKITTRTRTTIVRFWITFFGADERRPLHEYMGIHVPDIDHNRRNVLQYQSYICWQIDLPMYCHSEY